MNLPLKSDIVPYDQDEVIEWLERHNEIDLLEIFFTNHLQNA